MTAFDPELPLQKRRDAEYYFLQDMISKLNADCLAVKQWSVTSASIVAVVGQANVAYQAVAAIVLVLALSFWLTETVWRRNQFAFILRIRRMEAADLAGPQISSEWSRHYLNDAAQILPVDFSRVFWLPQTLLPHGVILGASAVVLMVSVVWPGWLPRAKPDASLQKIVVEQPVRFQQVK